MPKIVIGYWKLRGLFAPIQYLLEVAGLEYELELYEFEGKFRLLKRSVGYDDVRP